MRGIKPTVAGLAVVGAIFAGGASGATRTVQSVRVPKHPSVSKDLTISFRTRRNLPDHGYYYAVAVLVNYPRFTPEGIPSCALSSNMQKTAYGYRDRRGRVKLSLLAAHSREGRWCAGEYLVGIYAVPHPPPCGRSYSCHSRTASSACWEFEDHKVVCGLVAPECPAASPEPYGTASSECAAKAAHERELKEQAEREARESAERKAKETPEPPPGVPPYSYPGGLPKPIDAQTHVIAEFRVTF